MILDFKSITIMSIHMLDNSMVMLTVSLHYLSRYIFVCSHMFDSFSSCWCTVLKLVTDDWHVLLNYNSIPVPKKSAVILIINSGFGISGISTVFSSGVSIIFCVLNVQCRRWFTLPHMVVLRRQCRVTVSLVHNNNSKRHSSQHRLATRHRHLHSTHRTQYSRSDLVLEWCSRQLVHLHRLICTMQWHSILWLHLKDLHHLHHRLCFLSQ